MRCANDVFRQVYAKNIAKLFDPLVFPSVDRVFEDFLVVRGKIVQTVEAQSFLTIRTCLSKGLRFFAVVAKMDGKGLDARKTRIADKKTTLAAADALDGKNNICNCPSDSLEKRKPH